MLRQGLLPKVLPHDEKYSRTLSCQSKSCNGSRTAFSKNHGLTPCSLLPPRQVLPAPLPMLLQAGLTALHWAAAAGGVAVVSELLAMGAKCKVGQRRCIPATQLVMTITCARGPG